MKIKALSFRQPWAELVMQGKKTLDLRTWSTRHRGPLAIYASQTIEKERCEELSLDPEQLTTGAIIGLVDLTGVVELDQAAYQERGSEHLHGRHFQAPLYGWELANPRRIDPPVPTRGRQLLFDVDIPGPNEPLSISQRAESEPLPAEQTIQAWDNSAPFELRLSPEKGAPDRLPSYRLAVYQRSVEPPPSQASLYQKPPEQMERVVELSGAPLQAVADRVLEALRQNGYKATDLTPARREPFALQEESGVRLALLFLAVKPVSKVNRIESISSGIQTMTSEELYYWYSKCSHRAFGEQALKALRILLANE